MSDQMSNFRLVAEEHTNRSKKKVTPKILISAALALTLITGAFYAPLLWSSDSVSALTGRAQVVYQTPANASTVQADASLLSNQEALSSLYNQVSGSVVNIQVSLHASASDLNIPGFQSPQGDAPLQQAEGSGFIYDNDGHIVTNNHVVNGAETVTVIFNNGEWAKAEVVATDPQADLAVIKVTPPSDFTWKPLPLAQPDSLKPGHTVIAIGNPFGLEGTMTSGIVSALGRSTPVGEASQVSGGSYTLPDVIQTDAAINPGNSGGPLLNLAGEVVGVNFAIESASRSNAGVGFTIPVSIVRRVVPALIANGKFDYAYLGLSGITIGPDLATELKLSENKLGVYVGSVVAGGPSDKAGIHGGSQDVSTNGNGDLQAGGDIVIAIGDTPVHRFEDIVSYLVTKAEPGQKVALTVLRDGKEMKIDVTLGSRPSQTQAQQSDSTNGAVSARRAIQIAVDATKDTLTGEITQRVATPDTKGGKDVWVVELTTDSQTATVVIDRTTGDVVQVTVK
ncbi:MAG: trypsin-like peptidase domain-containing protein [Chloroflexi bacterium]|nr:trypsin-like peptidase domain-containing protein [Chloroflexota bacterium]